MAHSPSLRLFNGFRNNNSSKKHIQEEGEEEDELEKDNVKGWLMNVHSYRDEKKNNTLSSSSSSSSSPPPVSTSISTTSEYILVDGDNNRIPTESRKMLKKGRPESIASEDSVNLDELINNNFTTDMEDETDLPDLGDLDLDDVTNDFFKMDINKDNNDESLDSFDTGFNDFITKPSDLDWNPKEQDGIKEKVTQKLSPSPQYLRRSDSFSSENSLTSQSTITQYQRYGMTPLIYPSESTSTSSRSHSRLSNYSASSFASSASGIPHRTTTTTSNNNNSNNNNSNNNSNHHHHHQYHHTTSSNIGIPTPSRSYTYRDNNNSNYNDNNNSSSSSSSSSKLKLSQQRTPLTKRASHIPAPNSSSSKILPPSPQRTSSSSSARSTGLPTRRTMTPTSRVSTQQRQRASHIPSVRESIHSDSSNNSVNGSSSRRFLTANSNTSNHSSNSKHNDSISRPTSPLNTGRSASRLGIPTPSGIKKSTGIPGNGGAGATGLFQDRPRSITPTSQRTGIPHRNEEKQQRVMSPTGTRPSGLRPPGSSLRSPSRIGTLKKST